MSSKTRHGARLRARPRASRMPCVRTCAWATVNSSNRADRFGLSGRPPTARLLRFDTALSLPGSVRDSSAVHRFGTRTTR